MGLATAERKRWRVAFNQAWSFALKPSENDVPIPDPTVCICDFMQFVKWLPPDVRIKDEMLSYFCNKAKKRMLSPNTTIRVLILLVDTTPPPVKRMVEHAKRYKNKDIFDENRGPYLPRRGTDQIPSPKENQWIRFAGNYRLLQRELYPELFNAFMSCRFFTPRPGQMLVLSGFPGRSAYERIIHERPWEAEVSVDNRHVLRVQLWRDTELPITREMEAADPHLYQRVYILENVAPCVDFPNGLIRHCEWEAARNDIGEADLRMFYFDHWYQNEHILLDINDGDVIPIGLLYAQERVVAQAPTGKYEYRNRHTARLPYKQTEGIEYFAEDQVPEYEYVDFNILYRIVQEYAPFRAAGVQHPALTQVFLAILSETDFFKHFLPGIGAHTVMHKVFQENVGVFTHMVQMSAGVPASTRTTRTVVLDEDLLRYFAHLCYIEKHERVLLKKLKVTRLTYDQLLKKVNHTSKGVLKENEAARLPSRNRIRCWARQIEWNLLYWKNGPFGLPPDPFEQWQNEPYYPYWRDPADPTASPIMIKVVAARPKPVDQVYAQHLYRTKVKRTRQDDETPEQMAQRQKRIVEDFGGSL